MASPRPSKAPSIASSAGTTKSASLQLLPRYTPKPEPAYVSPAAAADYILHNRDEDRLDHISPSASPTNESAAFTDRSLGLLNSFLDSLLYNFLAKARGTSLRQLKPAITEVLKAKLARDALANADEELEGLLGEADLEEQEDTTAPNGQEGWSQEWHLEMAFKRMRLRVMVFIRLGDFDDEDEERFMDEEDDLRNGEKIEQEDLLASPAAVYLAGVLEYVAERALAIIGDAALKRAATKGHKRSASDDSMQSLSTGLVVQESDVEKITLNPTLGRLWRTWRKNYRSVHTRAGSDGLSPYGPPSPASERGFRGRLGSLNETLEAARRSSPGPDREEKQSRHLSADEIPDGDVLESDIAANIPLPLSDDDVREIETIELPDEDVVAAIPLPIGSNDVNEIEVPGLAKEISDDQPEEVVEAETRPRRPISAILSWLTPFSWAPEPRPTLHRMRSSSVPSRTRPSFLGEAVFTPAAEEPMNVEEASATAIDTEAQPESLDVEASVTVDKAAAPNATVEKTLEPAGPAVGISEPIAATEQDEDEGKTGIVAGTIAGTAALIGAAAAVLTGSVKVNEEPAEVAAPAASPATVSPSETKLPIERSRSPASSTIADRRRMFEAQNKSVERSPREVQSPVFEAPKSPVAPPERSSSLKNKSAVVVDAPSVAKPTIEQVVEAPEPKDISSPSLVQVDPRVDRKVSLEQQKPAAVHDEKDIGVARTSDVPVPYPQQTESTSPTPPERPRSYHLPGTQSRNGSGRTTPTERNVHRDRSLVGADQVLARDSVGPKNPLRTATKQEHSPKQMTGTRVAQQPQAQSVTFYHSDNEDKVVAQPQTSPSDAIKHRPPPLKVAPREPVETIESTIRPTSAARSTTPGGHSTKGSGSSSTMQRQLDKKSLEESRQRDFDSLLKNNEPVKYTLTPEDLRTTVTTTSRASALADRGPPSPRIISSPTTYTAKRTSPPRDNSATRRDTPSPTAGLNGLGRKPGVPRVSEYKRAAANRLSMKPEPLNTNSRRSGFLPREPRVMTDNTADLADYMASTAPAHEQTVVPIARVASASRLNGDRTSSPVPRSASRAKLVPREPDVKKDGTSDLIDFIRQGPPGSKPEKEQRRTVAPFRTTMDSDEFSGLGDFTNTVNASFSSNRNSLAASAGGSSAALLGRSSSRGAQSSLSTGGPPQIVKKQRRVKDPYAIDSDDDDDLLTSLPAGGNGGQDSGDMSLAEFLRSADPPSSKPRTTPRNGLSMGSHPNATPATYTKDTSAGRLGNGTPITLPSSRSAMTNSAVPVRPVSQARQEARAAGATKNGFGGNGFYYSTNDMADFLRSSGPVDNMAPVTQQVPLQKKPSKRGRLFQQF